MPESCTLAMTHSNEHFVGGKCHILAPNATIMDKEMLKRWRNKAIFCLFVCLCCFSLILERLLRGMLRGEGKTWKDLEVSGIECMM